MKKNCSIPAREYGSWSEPTTNSNFIIVEAGCAGERCFCRTTRFLFFRRCVGIWLDFCPHSAIIQQETCGRGGMADAPDLGSGGATRGGSSPLARTILFWVRNASNRLFLTNGLFFLVLDQSIGSAEIFMTKTGNWKQEGEERIL